MRYRIVVTLLTLGMFGGLFFGFHELRHDRRHAGGPHWKERVAEVCVEAAHRVLKDQKVGAASRGNANSDTDRGAQP